MNNKMSPQSKNILALLLILVLGVAVSLIVMGSGDSQWRRAKTVSIQPQGYLSNYNMQVEAADIFAGSERAELSIIVYENYLDPFSQALDNSLQQALADFPNSLLLAYRPFVPSGNFLAQEVAELLLCTHFQGKGLEARNWLLENTAQVELVSADLTDYINNFQLDAEQLQTCLADNQVSLIINDMMLSATAADIYGSPSLIVGHELLIGAVPYDNFIDSNGDYIEGLKSVIARQLNN